MPGDDENLPDWKRADPNLIARALAVAKDKPSGGWLVLDSSRTLLHLRRPRKYWVDDREVVAWTTMDRGLTVAPATCPHMGADLSSAKIDAEGCLTCPWHGMTLPPEGLTAQGWGPVRMFDDGVLTWVQFDPYAPDALPAPVLTKRPKVFLDGVIRREVRCEPGDIIANRLDPWHGAHFHPYAFHDLAVTGVSAEAFDVSVNYRVAPKYYVRIEARFACPEPNTIVMTITAGEGEGSVVETHATPLRSMRLSQIPPTSIVEATLATSERHGFAQARKGALLARPIIKAMAGRLWRDDAKYAERIFELRSRV